jgi:hypothetical protein
MTKMTKLFVDDQEINLFYKTFGHFDGADEYNEGWTQVRSYGEFRNFINTNGIPDVVSFDSNLNHSVMAGDFLGNGFECALFLKEKCLELGVDFPLWLCHSYLPDRELLNLLNEFPNRRVKDSAQITG